MTLRPAPMSRGIVICGGGRYLLSTVANIHVLRHHGCSLPIELWHFAGEMSWPARSHLRKLGVRTRPLPVLPNGYASKPWAIVNSAFDEVMCLDADNTPIRDPSDLFETEAYRDCGALFWPDYLKAPPNEAWKELADLEEPRDVYQQESGQLVIDRRRCEAALQQMLAFNLDYPKTKPYLWHKGGDKDTFQLAWYRTRSPFFMIERYPGLAGRWVAEDDFMATTMVQYDLEDRPLFMHNSGLKWHNVRPIERSWECFRETRDRRGEGVRVRIREFGPDHTHDFFPPEAYVDRDVREVIGDLEDVCMRILGEIRGAAWFRASLALFYPRFYAVKWLKRGS